MQAGIPYTVATGEKLVNETFGPNNIRRRTSGTEELQQVDVSDGSRREFSLDENGFVFVEHKTAVKDFLDKGSSRRCTTPRSPPSSNSSPERSESIVFDHTLRSGDEGEREAKLLREPVLSAHNDYTDWSGPNRVRELLPDEAEHLLKNRFAIIQVWRAINQPIQSNPLAIADAKSIAPGRPAHRRAALPAPGRPDLPHKYNPAHRWFYFPRMRRDEALVFKVLRFGEGRARALHAAHLV